MTHPKALLSEPSAFLQLQTVQRILCILLCSSPLCVDCLFYVWYPVSTAPSTYNLLLLFLPRVVRQLVVIVQFQPAPIHQSFIPFSIQSFQLRNSSFRDIDNLIWSQPMCFELPYMLHEFVCHIPILDLLS
jgi:hypothetical protein